MSVKERLQSGDWSGKTAKEIAEELGCSVDAVYLAQKQIKAETGEEVPYRKMHQKTKVSTGKRSVELKEALLEGEWSDLTTTEIAETLGVNTTEVYKALYRLKKKRARSPIQETKPRAAQEGGHGGGHARNGYGSQSIEKIE